MISLTDFWIWEAAFLDWSEIQFVTPVKLPLKFENIVSEICPAACFWVEK